MTTSLGPARETESTGAMAATNRTNASGTGRHFARWLLDNATRQIAIVKGTRGSELYVVRAVLLFKRVQRMEVVCEKDEAIDFSRR